jgi:hypothetical protein
LVGAKSKKERKKESTGVIIKRWDWSQIGSHAGVRKKGDEVI